MSGTIDFAGGRLARCAIAAAALLLAGCATVPPGAGSNPRDPWERFNRQVYAFNDHVDRYLLKPVAKGYVAVVPHAFRLCISSGFSNLGEVRNAVNDILQIKPVGAATDTGRLVINSTLGMAGCFDVATKMGLERRTEDFGLTLARWGLGSGPYLVLPVLGPSGRHRSDRPDGAGPLSVHARRVFAAAHQPAIRRQSAACAGAGRQRRNRPRGGRSQDEAGRTAARESALKWRNCLLRLGRTG